MPRIKDVGFLRAEGGCLVAKLVLGMKNPEGRRERVVLLKGRGGGVFFFLIGEAGLLGFGTMGKIFRENWGIIGKNI